MLTTGKMCDLGLIYHYNYTNQLYEGAERKAHDNDQDKCT